MTPPVDVLMGDIRDLSKLKHFRNFLWEVLSLCGVYNNNFATNSSLPYLEGRRSVGLEIIGMLTEADPTIYPRLLMEAAEKEYAEKDGKKSKKAGSQEGIEG